MGTLAADAVPVWEPAWTEWGNDRCRVRDPEGHEPTFGVHRPGEEVVAGQEWTRRRSPQRVKP